MWYPVFYSIFPTQTVFTHSLDHSPDLCPRNVILQNKKQGKESTTQKHMSKGTQQDFAPIKTTFDESRHLSLYHQRRVWWTQEYFSGFFQLHKQRPPSPTSDANPVTFYYQQAWNHSAHKRASKTAPSRLSLGKEWTDWAKNTNSSRQVYEKVTECGFGQMPVR